MGRITNLPISGRRVPHSPTPRSLNNNGDITGKHALFVETAAAACYAVAMAVYSLFLFPAYYFGVVHVQSADNALVALGCPLECAASQIGWMTTRKHLLDSYKVVQVISIVFLPVPLSIGVADSISKPGIRLMLAFSFVFCLTSAITSSLFLRKGYALSDELMEWYSVEQSRKSKGARLIEFWSCLTTPLSSILWSFIYSSYLFMTFFLFHGTWAEWHESERALFGFLTLGALLALISIIQIYHIANA